MLENVLIEKSLTDCHCEGLDSIVIKDGPGMVRMFIARPDHVLYRNKVDSGPMQKMSVAMHRHHCDVTLMPLVGEIYNVTFSSREGAFTHPLRSFRYKSPIAEGHGSFEPVDNADIPMRLIQHRLVIPLRLKAYALHTVYVPSRASAAWLIWEGPEDAGYNSVVYSNDDLRDFDFSNLNRPMTEERLREDLALIEVTL